MPNGEVHALVVATAVVAVLGFQIKKYFFSSIFGKLGCFPCLALVDPAEPLGLVLPVAAVVGAVANLEKREKNEYLLGIRVLSTTCIFHLFVSDAHGPVSGAVVLGVSVAPKVRIVWKTIKQRFLIFSALSK